MTNSGIAVAARKLSGLTPPAKAFFVAAAAQAQPRAVVLYVVPTDGDLEQAVGDIGFFLSALEGLGSAESTVLPFPSHEIDPYRGLAPHVGVTSARARALHAIATGTTRVVVASAASLLPRVTPPSKLTEAHRAALKAVIESGPTAAIDGVVRWRLVDLCQWIWEEFRSASPSRP